MGRLLIALVMASACGGTVEGFEATPECFPALVDCRGEGASRTCKQGQVCIPAAAALECIPYDLCDLGPGSSGPRVGECNPTTLRCEARNFWGSP